MKWLLLAGGILALPILINAPLLGILASPWAPFWLSSVGRTGGHVDAATGAAVVVLGPDESNVQFPIDPASLALGHGYVSDVQRYILAVAAGWSREDAILATALSIAEDGSGDPAALSPANRNGTRDLGLWQINSVHWSSCGGPVALTDPLTNARCGHGIFGPGRNWCAWSTYDVACGPGHTGAYLAFLTRARAAAQQPSSAAQA